MSHASVIIALEGYKPGTDLDDLVHHEMKPFDENDEWFREGSRWDWYQIGGRYSGKFAGQNYILRSQLSSSAIREYQANEARKWWRKFQQAQEHQPMSPDHATLIYGVKADDTEESYVRSHATGRVSAYAFLKDRKWHERGRLGWWGSTTSGEKDAELTATETVPLVTSFKMPDDSEASIIGYVSDTEEQWAEKYYERFIEPLAADTMLVCVDYHV